MNIFKNPNAFTDDFGNVPPEGYNSSNGSIAVVGSNEVTLQSPDNAMPAAGDTFHAVFDNRGASIVTLYFSQSGPNAWNDSIELQPGETFNYGVNLEPDYPFVIQMRVRTGNVYAIDMLVQDPDGNGGGGGETPELPEGADTFSCKAFMSFGALTNNDEHQVAPLGELSVRSQTFSRDRELFTAGVAGSNSTAITATVFSSRTAADGAVDTPLTIGDLLATMGTWMWNEAMNGSFTASTEIFRQAVLAEFGTRIYDVTVATMIQQGTIWLPESITFYLLEDQPQQLQSINGDAFLAARADPSPGYMAKARVKLWMSNAAFSTQYDEYEFAHLAPIDNLDDFFKTRGQVEELVAKRTDEEVFLKLQQLAAGDPYTIAKSTMFEFRDPDDPTYRLPTNWRSLIYGAAGDNIDAYKERLIEWILGNSTHTREEWAEIFPDIFTSTEFILIPQWNPYAIPNKTLDPGLYSPVVEVARANPLARLFSIGTAYNNAHIDKVNSVVPTSYKTVTLLAVGGPQNRDGVNKFFDQWTDYIAVSTSHLDHDRMDPITQGFVEKLHTLMKIAEDMTEFSDIPAGYTRLTRKRADGSSVIYVVSSYQNVQYLVVSKLSFNRASPPVTSSPLRVTVQGVEGVTTLENGSQSNEYQELFRALGGTAPYTYSLPKPKHDYVEAQSIDPVTGVYRATFRRGGPTKLTVRATDANGAVADTEFDLYILELT